MKRLIVAVAFLMLGCASHTLQHSECGDVAEVALIARSMTVEGVGSDQALLILRQIYNGPGMDAYRRELVARLASEASVSTETPSQFSRRLLMACSERRL